MSFLEPPSMDPLGDEPVPFGPHHQVSKREFKLEPEDEDTDFYRESFVQNVEAKAPSLFVAKTIPVTLKCVKTYSNKRRKQQSLSKTEFMEKMKKGITAIIKESTLNGNDPLEYHPFYLEMNKYISAGQKHGFIGTSEKDVMDIWVQFDNIAKSKNVTDSDVSERVDLSSYAKFILNGEIYLNGKLVTDFYRDEEAVLSRLGELEEIGKKICTKWGKKGRTTRPRTLRDDLKARLDFFNECKTMTFPGDVINMNHLWKNFLNGFKSTKPRKSRLKKTETTIKIVAKETGNPSDPNCQNGTALTSKRTRQLRKRKADSSPETHATEIEVPPEYQVSVVLEDIALNPKWASKLKPKRLCIKRTVVNMKKVIRRLRLTSPGPKKSSIRQKCSRSKSKVKNRRTRTKPKTRKKKKTKKELIQDKRFKIFQKAWKRNQFSLRMICKRRRHWEYQRIKRSEKVELTLEKIITGNCRLRTLDNRKTWFKRERKYLSVLDCPYCEKTCRTEQSKVFHVQIAHPKRYPDFKKKRAGEHQIHKKNRKSYNDDNYGKPKEFVCEECGVTTTCASSLRVHKAALHNSNRHKGKCPMCPEDFATGLFLWFHFLQKHLNYDIFALTKQKGEKRGFTYGHSYSSDRNVGTVIKTGAPKTPIIIRTAPDGSEEYVCDICDKGFETPYIATKHRRTLHRTEQEQQSWLCDQCGKTFKSKDARDAHVRQIHEGQDYRCDLCNKKMQTAGKLWRHKVEYHEMRDLEPPEGLNIMPCPYCGERIMRGLGAHVKKNHPEKIQEYSAMKKLEVKTKRNEPKAKRGKWDIQSKESRVRSTMKKRELVRRWKEENDESVPTWIKVLRPKKCHHCGINTKRMKQASWPDHLEQEHGTVVQLRKWICPSENCDRDYNTLSNLKLHVMEHFDLYNNLKVNKHISEVILPTGRRAEFNCLECLRNGVAVKKMRFQEEIMIHFILCHADIYSRLKGKLEPDLGEYFVKSPDEDEVSTLPITGDYEEASVPPPTIYDCPHCPTKLYSDYDLRCHVEVTHQHECWRCPFPDCTKVVLSPQEMDDHFMNEHSINAALPAPSTSEDKHEHKVNMTLTTNNESGTSSTANNSGQQNDTSSNKVKAGRKGTKLR